MKILLGLGNPGPEYAGHRHNIGFWCADLLARRGGIRLRREGSGWEGSGELAGVPVVVAKPRTFMNRSGAAARELLGRHGADAGDLVVIHDDVDLPLGTLRLKSGGGHGGHNGLRSIVQALATADFVRIRLGVGRPGSDRVELADWVLSDFEREEKAVAAELAGRGAEAVEALLTLGLTAAMNRFHVPLPTGGARTD